MRSLFLLCVTVIIISCSESPRFELLTSDLTNIDFKNTIVETDSLNVISYENIYNGAGVGIGDLNSDGLQDIVFAGNQVSSKIYLNLGNFRFKDITSNFAGLANDQWYSGVTIVDINNDRLPDVYLTATGSKNPEKRKNKLWINNGAGNAMDPTFTEMAEKYGIDNEDQSVAAAFFDYDNDGDLDLYVLNNTVNQRMNTSYRPKINDGSSPCNDRLYRNNGYGTFTEVSKEAGIIFEGFGLGMAIGDVNKDGYPDIYVSNDYISNDLLYINQGDGTFRNEISKYISYQTTSSMGNDMADVNNDGNPDIMTLDMMPESYNKKKQTINGFSYIYYQLDEKFGFEHQYLRNMLHLHNGFLNKEMLPFSEVGQMMGIYQTEWSWSPLFADYDNDGDKDLIVTNGYPRDLTDKDWLESISDGQGLSGVEQNRITMIPAVKVPNMAFDNIGDLSFIKRTDWLPNTPSYSSGASFADLDNDGDLDYVVNNVNDKAFILKNNTVEKLKKNTAYIKIRLLGRPGNTMALGAKIEIWNKGTYQFTEHFLTRGYASSVDPVIHFGISEADYLDSIKVTWPADQKYSMLKNVPVNQIIDIDEMNSGSTDKFVRSPRVSNYMFVKSDSIINYVHEQTDFVDFFLNQKIIPHKFSQIGPCMARGDLDGDGYEDVIIGSTNKLPTTAFLRRGMRFKKESFEGLTTQKGFTESDLAITDIDGDGDNDIIAVAGGYENKKESEEQQNLYMAVAGGYETKNESDYTHFIYENRNGSFIKTALPVPPFPASVVRPFDFNHDGYTEIFIGSRVKKGMYPYANNSWLILNNKGRLSAEPATGYNLGMVTDALWTDYNKDGWEDLMIVREWDSPVILKNMNGKGLVPQNIPELENYHGFWYSIIAGDFDQDGDDDYILGNLGENHRFSVSTKYPLSLYAIDLDLDGNIDPVTTAYWKDQKGNLKEFPVNYLDELREQSSFFQMKFKDYTTFSNTSFDAMFDETMLKKLDGYKLQVNKTSSCILWNDAGSFRWEVFPRSLQVSPVKKMIVCDFNGDSYPDVLLAGNDYTYDVATGYYDSNKGFVLLNKGKVEKGQPAFEVLTASQSGLLLQGMVESLLYFKGDTSLIVAGINRSKVAVFEHNPDKIRIK